MNALLADKVYCYLCRDDNVAMVWGAYHCVHSTSFLCTVSQCIHIESSLHTSARFLFRNLFMTEDLLFLFFFDCFPYIVAALYVVQQ